MGATPASRDKTLTVTDSAPTGTGDPSGARDRLRPTDTEPGPKRAEPVRSGLQVDGGRGRLQAGDVPLNSGRVGDPSGPAPVSGGREEGVTGEGLDSPSEHLPRPVVHSRGRSGPTVEMRIGEVRDPRPRLHTPPSFDPGPWRTIPPTTYVSALNRVPGWFGGTGPPVSHSSGGGHV